MSDDYYSFDITSGDELEINLYFDSAGLPPEYQGSPYANPPAFPTAIVDDDGTQHLGNINTFNPLPLVQQPNLSYPVAQGVDNWLPDTYWSLPSGQATQPTVEPWETYSGGGQFPPPSPPHASQTPPDLPGDASSPSPSSPTPSDSSAGHLYRCNVQFCERPFKKSNDLKRHSSTVHGEHNNKTIAQVLKEAEGKAGAPVKIGAFARFALGEGIEKDDGPDFAAEVAAAAGQG